VSAASCCCCCCCCCCLCVPIRSFICIFSFKKRASFCLLK
jgi:hypothetical protein